MKRWVTIGVFYGALFVFGSVLGGMNGFGVVLFGAVLVLAFMTLMAFIGKAFQMWARRLYRDTSPSEIRARLYGPRSN